MKTKLTISPYEAAKLLGIGRTTVYSLIRDGSLPSIKLGRRILIPLAALDDWVRGSTHEGTQKENVQNG